jgi:hypothetical protein
MHCIKFNFIQFIIINEWLRCKQRVKIISKSVLVNAQNLETKLYHNFTAEAQRESCSMITLTYYELRAAWGKSFQSLSNSRRDSCEQKYTTIN